MPTTRLAPSPTGALHLGNARTFLANWLLARQRGWKIILRIEDLDGPRIKRGADREAIKDLKWLGIDWDEGPIYQSTRREAYSNAVKRLLAAGKAYPCICTRREVDRAASAPHAEDGAAVYPGTCRGKFESVEAAHHASGRTPTIRFNVDDEVIEFVDELRGRQRFEMSRLGDFVIEKADGTPAYQLAVVVDDADMGVTEIVRGNDLMDSTPRQIMLYRALGMSDRIPRYYHLPLVVGPDDRRLAKRHGDTRLSHYREAGVPASRVLELLARWMNIDFTGAKSASDLIGRYRIDSEARESIMFTADDDAFLRAGASH
jgi:glutamyl-tRNA synthetase